MPSRIGTAPLSPVHSTKTRSARRRRTGSRSSPTNTGRTTNASATARTSPIHHAPPSPQVAEADRQPQHRERDDLAEARQRGVEPLDLPLVRRALVAEEDAGREDGEEPRAVRDRRQPVHHERAEQHPQRVQALAGQRHPPHEDQQRHAARDAHGRPDDHLLDELQRTPARPRPRPRRSRSAAPPCSAMPTGSFAPDSPSRRVPVRPAISRRPSTENTTAGSVGASAVPSSIAMRQSMPNA